MNELILFGAVKNYMLALSVWLACQWMGMRLVNN